MGSLVDGDRHVPHPVLANRPQVLQAKPPDKTLPIASSRLPEVLKVLQDVKAEARAVGLLGEER